MDKELIELKIKCIEDRIRHAAKNIRFGDSSFSGWYKKQVKEIEKWQERLKSRR